MHVLTAKLAGRRYHPGLLEPTSILALRRDKANRVDRSAVAIMADGETVGYLEAGLARLVAPLLDRHRPVFVSPIKGNQKAINLFVPTRSDRLGRSLQTVISSDGQRQYVVDAAHRLCTCPAGRFLLCRHIRALSPSSVIDEHELEAVGV